MSMFENDQYCWRETYFVLFDSAKRPTLKKVETVLSKLHARLTFTNGTADDDGAFDSVTVLAPDDFAALDISYLSGEEVLEQGALLAEEMEKAGDAANRSQIGRLRACDARFDVLHFEQIVAFEDEEPEDMLDPTALLVVLEALAELTGGVAIDPQAGTIL
jgi:hypothetical protein